MALFVPQAIEPFFGWMMPQGKFNISCDGMFAQGFLQRFQKTRLKVLDAFSLQTDNQKFPLAVFDLTKTLQCRRVVERLRQAFKNSVYFA
ncbi:MAG: hypothetical protein HPY45_02730 [Anaerolineae bacterium]|nr:hypothetical protein [Anaerolineae bacterium]